MSSATSSSALWRWTPPPLYRWGGGERPHLLTEWPKALNLSLRAPTGLTRPHKKTEEPFLPALVPAIATAADNELELFMVYCWLHHASLFAPWFLFSPFPLVGLTVTTLFSGVNKTFGWIPLCNPMVACVSEVRCYDFAYNNTSTTITLALQYKVEIAQILESYSV